MLLTIFTASAINNYNNRIKQQHLLSATPGEETPSGIPMNVVIAIFAIEILLMIWALFLAWRCGGNHQDRFIHIIVALLAPIFYILYYFITGCGSFSCGAAGASVFRYQ
jgi:hypothetical protein